MINMQEDKISNVIVRERWKGINFNRQYLPVDLSITGSGEQPLSVGEVVYQDLDIADSPFRRIARSQVFPTNFRVAIVIDGSVGNEVIIHPELGQQKPDWSIDSTDIVYLGLIVRGDCVVRRSGLSFGTSSVTSVAENTALMRLQQQGIFMIGDDGNKFSQPRPYHNYNTTPA